MPLLIHVRQLEAQGVHLQGELSCDELEWDTRDEMIRVTRGLLYDLSAEQVDGGILVQGRLRQALDCECVRCLKPFVHEVSLGDWSCLLPLTGEDKVLVVNDAVDLTPFLRDDIFLAFPQHPLCSPQCNGLANQQKGRALDGGQPLSGSPVWEQLNKLKL